MKGLTLRKCVCVIHISVGIDFVDLTVKEKGYIDKKRFERCICL